MGSWPEGGQTRDRDGIFINILTSLRLTPDSSLERPGSVAPLEAVRRGSYASGDAVGELHVGDDLAPIRTEEWQDGSRLSIELLRFAVVGQWRCYVG